MRPSFHFTARRGWINDPHGITFRDGRYHGFYQHVPESMHWTARCRWGHAAGPDLLSLTELPIALEPDEDEDGVWSGSVAVNEAGDARIFYTAVSEPNIDAGRIRVATPGDSTWSRWNKGAVVARPPEGLDLTIFRDPFLRRVGEDWEMFVGASNAARVAMVLRYTSTDLENWQYGGVAVARSTTETEPVWLGRLWECPQFFEIDGRDVMVTSVWDGDPQFAAYAIGEFRDGRFTAEVWGRLTYGPNYYAPSYFSDRRGRPCLSFWMRGFCDDTDGWAGAHSLPYELTIAGDRLAATPHPDLEQYRSPESAADSHASSAIDVTWAQSHDPTLRITSNAVPVARCRRTPAGLHVTAGNCEGTLPGAAGDIRLILDGQILEVSCEAGLISLPVEPSGAAYAVHAERARVHALHRTGDVSHRR